MKDNNERPYKLYFKEYEQSIRGCLIKMYNKDIREHYAVSGLAMDKDGNWFIELEKNLLKEDA